MPSVRIELPTTGLVVRIRSTQPNYHNKKGIISPKKVKTFFFLLLPYKNRKIDLKTLNLPKNRKIFRPIHKFHAQILDCPYVPKFQSVLISPFFGGLSSYVMSLWTETPEMKCF